MNESDCSADDRDGEAEVLAGRVDDLYEHLTDALLALDAARADAAAARAEVDVVEDLVAAGRDLVDALAKVREVERSPVIGNSFPWDERRARVARLHEAFMRAEAAFGEDKSRAGVVYAAIDDVAAFIESDADIQRELGLLPRSTGKAPFVAAKVRERFRR